MEYVNLAGYDGLEEPKAPISLVVRVGDWIEWEEYSARGAEYHDILDDRGNIKSVLVGQVRLRGLITGIHDGTLITAIRPLNDLIDGYVRYTLRAPVIRRILTPWDRLPVADQLMLLDHQEPDIVKTLGPPSPDWPSR